MLLHILCPNVENFCLNNGQFFSVGDATASPCHTLMAIIDSFMIVSFFLEKHFRNIIVDQHATFVPDYANLLVEVVAIFSVLNRVPATTPAHNVFCYSGVAHILTPAVNLAFRPISGFKSKC